LLWAIIGFVTIIVVSIWSVKYLQRTSDEMTERIDIIAENVVKREISEDDHRELIDSFIDEL